MTSLSSRIQSVAGKEMIVARVSQRHSLTPVLSLKHGIQHGGDVDISVLIHRSLPCPPQCWRAQQSLALTLLVAQPWRIFQQSADSIQMS